MAARDGHQVILVTALADDPLAARLRALLVDAVDLVQLSQDGAGESGRIGAVSLRATEALDAADAVLASDYGHGVCAVPELRRLLSALAGGVPVVWDPHPRGPDPVAGVRLVTPNLAEARTFAGQHGVVTPVANLAAVTTWADRLVHAWRVDAVAVTIGERGCPAKAVPCGDRIWQTPTAAVTPRPLA